MTAKRKPTRVEKLAMGQIRPRKRSLGDYDRRKHRLREIDTVAKARYGRVLPASADATPFLTAVAFTANAMGVNTQRAVAGWCARFAPHLAARVDDIFPPIRLEVEGRRYDLNADDAADLLGVTFEERQSLSLRTIGACDLTPDAFRVARKEAKRKRDRERLAQKRKAKRPRSKALMRVRPWEAEGISRRTWYRRQKRNGTDLSPCAQGDGTDLSLTRNIPDKATLLCHAATDPSVDELQTAGGAPRAAVTEDTDDAV